MGVKLKVRRLEGSEGINQGSEVGRTGPRDRGNGRGKEPPRTAHLCVQGIARGQCG